MSIRALFVPAGLVLAAAGLLSTSTPADAAVLFYGGDIAVGNSTPSYAPNSEEAPFYHRTHTSFTVPAGQTWHIDGVFAHMIFQDPNTLSNVTQGRFEFRSGLSEGNAGVSVVPGTSVPVTVTDTGFNAIFNLYDVGLVEAAFASPIELSAGQYWVSFTGVALGGTRLLMGTTFGANAVNPSPGNDFRDSNFFSLNFAATDLEPPLGLRGTAIPAPGAAALLLAGTALVIRRRRAS